MGTVSATVTMSAALRPSLNFTTKGAAVTDLADLKGLLSDFQVEKLTYFFTQFFDHDKNGMIDANDVERLNERLRLGRGGIRMTRSISPWKIITGCSSSVCWTRSWLRRILKDWKIDPGKRQRLPANWCWTPYPSPPGFICGPGSPKAAAVSTTILSGFNSSQGISL